MRYGLVLALVGLLVAPASANLLVNGDFDTGNLNSWQSFSDYGGPFQIGSPTVESSGNVWSPNPLTTSGTYHLRRAVGQNLPGGNFGVYQQVAVTPGLLTNLSGDVAGGVGGFGTFNGAAWFEVKVMDQAWNLSDIDNNAVASLAYKKELTAEGGFGWEHFSFDFTPTSSVVTVYVKYGAWDPEWDYAYFGAYYDSLSLTQVPEPTALALLLAGLPLLRRRRA